MGNDAKRTPRKWDDLVELATLALERAENEFGCECLQFENGAYYDCVQCRLREMIDSLEAADDTPLD